MVRPRQPGRPFPAVAPFMDLQGATQKPRGETGRGQTVGGALTSAQRPIGDLGAEGLRFYDVSRPTQSSDYVARGFGFLSCRDWSCSEKSPLCCPGGWKICSWQPTSHSGREELQYPRGGTLAIAWA
ncbi:hypothetical protein GWK47_044084 [Chionoecetes opilio]|uniref:Uncharacterized protein n=1 Tax=Chionoecetes opilio TaxID=41210 RepID=A0A8J4Y7M5_CHIOP|nr:hypothetical protein GWK47_044084 [Chionoecetes opilio]